MKLGVSQSPVQGDATSIVFLSGVVFVCSVVSRWCVCVCCAWCAVSVAASSSTWPRSWVPLSMLSAEFDSEDMSVYGTCAFSFRIQQRLGGCDVLGGGGGGGDVAAAELFKCGGARRAATSHSQGTSPLWSCLRSSSSTVCAPCRELIQRFHGCSSWTRLFLNVQG